VPLLAATPPRLKLESFGYKDVTLTGGALGSQAKEARSFYLNLNEDSLLQGFRIRAGLPAPGKPMGGWYDPEGFAGAHPFGQFVSALARMYAVTGDARFKQKVERLVHGFQLTIASDGFFYSSQKVFKNWPCYLYDKNCIGMRDAFTLTGNKEALVVLSRMTDWAVKNLPRRNDEWYTLPENLYACYKLTGEKRYLEMAKEFDYSKDFYNGFSGGQNGFKSSQHAYSHINTLTSAAKIYESTGDTQYLQAAEGAWKWLTETQMYASGGWGPNERFVETGKGKLNESLTQTADGFETPCGSYANVNLDRYLLRFTGESKYGDNMERLLINGMLATLPPIDDGHSFYYSDYRPGAQKIRRSEPWTCCSGTYAQITADYPLDIYFHDDRDLTVNLYVPSTVQWKRGDQVISLVQATDYPNQLETKLTFTHLHPAQFALRLRIPKWANDSIAVRINDKLVRNPLAENGFLKVDRKWHASDTIRIVFPSKIHLEPIDAENPDRVALMVGPKLMVALSDKDVIIDHGQANLDSWIKPVAGSSDYESSDSKVIFRPLYLVQGERYTTYIKLGKR
jgi:DUF1680 family protein